MLRRNDRNLVLSDGIVQTKRQFFGRFWRALRMRKGSSLRLSTPRRFLPFSRLPSTVGWLAVGEEDRSRLRVSYERPDAAPAVLDLRLGNFPAEVFLPLPRTSDAEPDGAALSLFAEKGESYLLVNEVMDRSALVARCRGRGVELGPGHQPQVRPSASVNVRYVEQKSADSWIGTYDSKGVMQTDAALWERYIIGTASDIPEPDGTLDFIFSSHVLEHLINPLHCLEHWSRKLRDGGIAVCVVPDAMGCKDYVFNLSNPKTWEDEYASGTRDVYREHFARYARGRGMPNDRVDKMMESGFSIHVHFYSRENVLFLLQACVDRGWFRGYELDFRPNNKDFHLVLCK
jgi:predicted SAM-dependent methyltransferase